MAKKQKNNFYAYTTEQGAGIVDSWAACERKVKGRKARYRGFPTRAEADSWLAAGASYSGGTGRKSKSKKVYAYHTESGSGIVGSWDECSRKVQGHKARYRGFPDRASAQRWLDDGAPYEDKAAKKAEALAAFPDDAVFFDSGTGPGHGAEVRVTDAAGVPLIHLAGDLPGTLTKEGNLILGHDRTNNYGELLGCLLALRAAEELGSKHIYGDSRLVLEHWSRGHVKREKRQSDPDLSALVDETVVARRQFESAGGSLDHVSGGINPADLGYHRD